MSVRPSEETSPKPPISKPVSKTLAWRLKGEAPPPRSEGAADEELLSLLDGGDFEGTLSLLMETHGPAVYRFCRAFLSDPDLAEDAHQMTFVQAFEGLSRFRGESSFASWLFGIARHRCLDAAKSQRRRQRRFLATDQPPETAYPDPGPEEGLSLRARGRALARCLAELAPQVRATVLLRYQQELSYAEIGSLRGEKAAALQMRVARALPVLRRCLETWGWKP